MSPRSSAASTASECTALISPTRPRRGSCTSAPKTPALHCATGSPAARSAAARSSFARSKTRTATAIVAASVTRWPPMYSGFTPALASSVVESIVTRRLYPSADSTMVRPQPLPSFSCGPPPCTTTGCIPQLRRKLSEDVRFSASCVMMSPPTFTTAKGRTCAGTAAFTPKARTTSCASRADPTFKANFVARLPARRARSVSNGTAAAERRTAARARNISVRATQPRKARRRLGPEARQEESLTTQRPHQPLLQGLASWPGQARLHGSRGPHRDCRQEDSEHTSRARVGWVERGPSALRWMAVHGGAWTRVCTGTAAEPPVVQCVRRTSTAAGGCGGSSGRPTVGLEPPPQVRELFLHSHLLCLQRLPALAVAQSARRRGAEPLQLCRDGRPALVGNEQRRLLAVGHAPRARARGGGGRKHQRRRGKSGSLLRGRIGRPSKRQQRCVWTTAAAAAVATAKGAARRRDACIQTAAVRPPSFSSSSSSSLRGRNGGSLAT